MRVEVCLFARARELYGGASATLELPPGSTADDCFAAVCADAPALDKMRPSLLLAVNESYAGWDAVLAEGDEVAFIPPVSGG
jgi:molybdopterin converting factor subunit 1